MRLVVTWIAMTVGVAAWACIAWAQTSTADDATLKRGRYVVLLSHCNNCHTAGYVANQGNVPETRWLSGNPVGWRGREGTVYASNLRSLMQQISVESWLQLAKTARYRAPMPWWSLHDTSDEDLAAMYWYIRSLGPAETTAPAFLPAGRVPPPPYNQLPDMSLAN